MRIWACLILCSSLVAQQYEEQPNVQSDYNDEQAAEQFNQEQLRRRQRYSSGQPMQKQTLTPGQEAPTAAGAEHDVASIDQQIRALQQKQQMLEAQGKKCEEQANQIFFYDALRARTLIHEAESYQAQAQAIQQQIWNLQHKKEDLQRFEH